MTEFDQRQRLIHIDRATSETFQRVVKTLLDILKGNEYEVISASVLEATSDTSGALYEFRIKLGRKLD
jgi:hypothetical protein